MGPEKAIDGREDTLFSSKKAKYPWLSLHVGNKPWRVITAMTVKVYHLITF